MFCQYAVQDSKDLRRVKCLILSKGGNWVRKEQAIAPKPKAEEKVEVKEVKEVKEVEKSVTNSKPKKWGRE